MADRYPVGFSIGTQDFRVQRMGAIDGFRLWHEFASHWVKTNTERPEASIPSEMPDDWTPEAWHAFHDNQANADWLNQRLMQLPSDYLDGLRERLFACMEARIEDEKGALHWLPLAEVEETVFASLDHFAVTEAAVRCFFIYFRRSFGGVKTLYYTLLAERRRPIAT